MQLKSGAPKSVAFSERSTSTPIPATLPPSLSMADVTSNTEPPVVRMSSTTRIGSSSSMLKPRRKILASPSFSAKIPRMPSWRAKSSSAEVDYLAVMNGKIFPVEVKSGSSGRLKSLHLCLDNYPNCRKGFVFSSRPYADLPDCPSVYDNDRPNTTDKFKGYDHRLRGTPGREKEVRAIIRL